MLPASQSERIVYGRNEMPPGSVSLVNEGNSEPAGRRPQSGIGGGIGEGQCLADAQGHIVKSVVRAILGGSIRVAAVLDAVAEFVQGRGRQCGLERAGPHEVAETEWVSSAYIGNWQAALTSLPVVPVVPCEGDLFLGRREKIDSGGRKIGVVVILGIPCIGVAIQISAGDLGRVCRYLIVDGENRLSNGIKSRPGALGPCDV